MSRDDWLLERKKEKGYWLWSNSKEVAKLKAHKIWKYTNKHFFQETTLEFQAQCRYPSKKPRLCTRAQQSAPGLCFHAVSVSSGEVHYLVHSLLSLKMAGTSMYTVTYQVPFCTSTQALVPAHQAWTAPTISDIHWLECYTAVLSQRSGFKSQQVWIFGGLILFTTAWVVKNFIGWIMHPYI